MGLLARWFARQRPLAVAEVSAADLDAALARTAARVEPRLKSLRGWPERYRHHIAGALAQAARVSRDIPGPLELDAQHYVSDPTVHAFFAAPAEIGRLLRTSPAIRAYVAGGGSGEIYALLSLRRRERYAFAVEMQGDIVRRDVPQRLMLFSDPVLSVPAPTEAQAREALKWALFDRFLERVVVGVQRVRDERDRLRGERDLLQAALRSGETGRRAQRRARLDDILRRLGEIADILELDHLHELVGTVLSHPEDCLYLQPYSVILDGMNVVRPAQTGTTVHKLTLMELHERYQEDRTVALAHFSLVTPADIDDSLQQADRWLA